MKLTFEQFTEAGFIFEKENGNSHSDYENQIISESELIKFTTKEMEGIIVEGINTGTYENEDERVNGYWSLSKIGNPNLIEKYKKWLLIELENANSIAVFQLLICLDKLEQPAFHKKRNSRGVFEKVLNFRDAQEYLVPARKSIIICLSTL
jgi:hypothetical protein